MGDLNEWYLSRLDELCRCEKFEQSCDSEPEGAYSWTSFSPVVNFEENRVLQACTCDQRFNMTQVPGRYCCALGALRKCAYFPLPVCLHTVVVFVRTLWTT